MYGGTTREDPQYPGILSHPDTVCEVVIRTLSVRVSGMLCMGGQLGRILSIPGYLVFRTLSVSGMNGGTTREDPEYPGILSIPDTVSMRWYVWGDKSGGSRVSRDT